MFKTNWPTKKLGELADVRMGETLIKKDLTGDGTPIFSAGTDINPWGFTKKNKLVFGKNSIVLSARGNIGEPRLPLLEKFTATQTTIVVTNKSENILDTVFLWRFLQTFNFNILKNQAAIPMMTVRDVNKIEIPLPPIKIQKQIVARIEELFKKIDKAIKLRTEAQRDVDIIIPSTLHQIFAGLLKSKIKNQKSKIQIKIQKLEEVCEKIKQIHPKKIFKSDFNYIDITSIDPVSKSISKTKRIPVNQAPSRARKLVKQGDTIFATTRPYLKNIAYITQNFNNCIASTGFCVIRPKKKLANPLYIFHIVNAENFISQILPLQRGASYPAVSDSDVYKSKIPLPPLSEQKKIVVYLDNLREKTEKLKQLQQNQLEELTELKQSILQKSFSDDL